jgi:hypothetical protein
MVPNRTGRVSSDWHFGPDDRRGGYLHFCDHRSASRVRVNLHESCRELISSQRTPLLQKALSSEAGDLWL